MSRSDEIDRRLGPAEGPDYTHFHAVVVDAIRYGTSGLQSPQRAAREALVRLRSGVRPLLPPTGPNEGHLEAAISEAVELGAAGSLTTDDAAHAALAAVAELGVVTPPRGPDDPFSEQQ